MSERRVSRNVFRDAIFRRSILKLDQKGIEDLFFSEIVKMVEEQVDSALVQDFDTLTDEQVRIEFMTERYVSRNVFRDAIFRRSILKLAQKGMDALFLAEIVKMVEEQVDSALVQYFDTLTDEQASIERVRAALLETEQE